MPHVSDVRPTSHDRHDPMLVAALAADDLAGTDRDQAIALTRSCADCATLHDDLLALARATAAAPPPVPTPRRDFRLTPADAARLRPSGWRRLVAAVSAPRSVVTRPLGVGLATLGLVGLLIGNVQLGGTTASPNEAGASDSAGQFRALAPAASAMTNDANAAGAGASLGRPPAQVPGTGVAAGAAGSPAPVSAAGSGSYAAPIMTEAPHAGAGQPVPNASAGQTTADQATGTSPETLAASSDTGNPAGGEPFRPINVLFGAAVVVGLGLLVATRFGSRRSA